MTAHLGGAPAHRFTPRDILAGLSVALVAIPQSMAYAELAGLPSHHGLYAVGFPLIAAAFFASSPYLQTGPVATTSLLTFGALVPLAAPGSDSYVAMAALLALVVGAVRVTVGLFRLGWISYLMSRPVLEGFVTAAAVLIISSQLPGAVGATAEGRGVLAGALWAVGHPEAWEGASLLFSAGTVAVILVSRRIHPLIPGVLIAAVAGVVASLVMDYAGPVVGHVPAGLPPLSLDLPWSQIPVLFLPGVVIALVGFAEAASISRAFASEDRQRWDANREFISQGVANLVSGVSGAFPVGGSFGRSSLNRLAGARSRWAGLVTGMAVLSFLPFSHVIGPMPRAVLSGIVIAAVWNMMRPQRLVAIWRLSRPQALVGWGTFLLTLALAPHIEQAVVIGVLMAGAVHLWRELAPEVPARREGDTLIVEPSGVLWFASAPALDDQLLEHLVQEPDVNRVVLDFRGLGRIDLTAAMALMEMLAQIREAGVEVEVRNIPDHALRVLRGAGLAP